MNNNSTMSRREKKDRAVKNKVLMKINSILVVGDAGGPSALPQASTDKVDPRQKMTYSFQLFGGQY